MAHGPAQLRLREVQRGQGDTDRYRDLAPAGTVVVTDDNDATLTHGDQAIARAGDIEQLHAGGFGEGHRRQKGEVLRRTQWRGQEAAENQCGAAQWPRQSAQTTHGRAPSAGRPGAGRPA